MFRLLNLLFIHLLGYCDVPKISFFFNSTTFVVYALPSYFQYSLLSPVTMSLKVLILQFYKATLFSKSHIKRLSSMAEFTCCFINAPLVI